MANRTQSGTINNEKYSSNEGKKDSSWIGWNRHLAMSLPCRPLNDRYRSDRRLKGMMTFTG